MPIEDVAIRKSNLSDTKKRLLEKLLRRSSESAPEKLLPPSDGPRIIPNRPHGPSAPLSFAQERLWFLHQLNPRTSAYNMPTSLKLTGRFTAAALQQALIEVARRHETLRTTFGLEGGKPAQFVHPLHRITLQHVDISSLGHKERTAIAMSLADSEANRPFDLNTGPLFRAVLLRLGDMENVLVVTMHHIISDGWSMGVLVHEVSSLYSAFAQGAASALNQLPIQYADFSIWQRRWLQGRILEEQLSYWRRHLSGAPEILEIPTDRSRPPVQSYRGAALPLEISPGPARALADLASSSGATLFMALLAAFQSLLFRYSGQSDVVVGSPIANRNRIEIEGLIGFFVNTLAYRARISRRQSFRQLLDEVKETTLEAYARQDLPFERVVEELHPERNVSYNPLFQVAFALQNAPVQELELHGLVLAPLPFTLSSTRFDLEFHLWEHPGRLSGFVSYSVDLFDAPTILRMAAHFQNLIRGVSDNPLLIVEELDLLGEAERCQLLTEWNDTAASFPQNKLVHQLVETWSALTPDSLSVSDGDNHLTYARLNEDSGKLARHLLRFQQGLDSVVGVLMDRSVQWVSAMLGILKAGAGYACFDPSYPKDRLSYMAEDCRAQVVITGCGYLHLIQREGIEIVDIESVWSDYASFDDENRGNAWNPAEPGSVSYVVYTSGSTGKPKGIVTSHASLLNLVAWHRRAFGVTARDRASQIARCGFDAAAWEIWPYLASGSSVVLVDETTRLSPSELRRWLIRNDVTIGWLPPALAEPIFQDGDVQDLKMRIMFSGSDRLVLWPPAGAGFSYVNAYGPSEGTVIVTAGVVHSREGVGGMSGPHIGRPLANNLIHILDRDLQAVPIGVSGELSIEGRHLARGYLLRPDLTAEKFVPAPLAGVGARIYRTGDLARWRPDGNLEFLGRIDNQVKIRGFRIELGEIESVLLENPLVREALVLARELADEKAIVAYVAPAVTDADSTELEILESNHISEWRMLYEQTYSQPGGDPDFNIRGWNSSYTGAPIAKDEMRQWTDAAVAQVLRRGPRRVLEIGCGTGLLLLTITQQVDEYWGTDFCAASLAYLRSQLDALSTHARKVKLLQKSADDFDGIPMGYFDCVILNSVIQYFPGCGYLLRVLTAAVRSVRPGGFVFVGDVRNLDLLEAFQTSILLQRPPPFLTIEEMRSRIRASVAREEELLVSPKFFGVLPSVLSDIGAVEIQPKRGQRHNELTKFRYEVILHVGPREPRGISARLDWLGHSMGPDKANEVLASGDCESVLVQNVPNSRTVGDIEAARALMMGFDPGIDDLIERARKAASEASDPEDFCRIGERFGYEARLYVSRSFDNRFFDVLFARQGGNAGVQSRQTLYDNAVVPSGGMLMAGDGLRTFFNRPLQDKISGWLAPELRRFLSERLPEYMVPASLIVIESLPRNANGKVDRKSLPRPSPDIRGDVSGAYTKLATPEEELIVGVWKNVLGIDRVRVTDNFFDIGGHSLRATQVVSAIRDIFKVEISLVDFFAEPTVAASAAKVTAARRAGGGMDLPPIRAAIRDSVAPVSLAQQRLWFIDQLTPGTPVYNVPLAVRITGRINIHILAQALSEVVRRHETLRTTTFIEQDCLQQHIQSHSHIYPALADLSGLPNDASELEARALAGLERRRPFDLRRGPLARFSILRLDAWQCTVLVTLHHIVSDGWSLAVFMNEIARLYEALLAGVPSPLEELEIQYADFCYWQREWVDGGVTDRQIAFWREAIGDSPPIVELPPDKPRPPIQSFVGAVVPLAIRPNVFSRVKEAARGTRATVFMVLLAAFQALLHRYSGEETIIAATPIAGRNRAELEPLIGFFVNTLIMKASVSGRLTFRELLEQVRQFALGAYSNQEVPFEKLVEELRPARDLSRNPLFQIMFALQSMPSAGENRLGRLGLQLGAQESDGGGARFDLEIQLFEDERDLAGTTTYCAELYDESTILRLLSQYVTFLDRAATDPGRRIEDLSLMTDAEESQAAGFCRGERTPATNLLIHQFVESQTRRTPDAIAVVHCDHFCSYLGLAHRAEGIAAEVRRRGMPIESRIGVFVRRGIEMVAALLGILKCGAAYVPIDPSYPKKRISTIIRDSELTCVMTERAALNELLDHGIENIFIEDVIDTDRSSYEKCAPSLPPEEQRRIEHDSANLAYVIYTSGSTGLPKGVAIEHRSAAALLQWASSFFTEGELSWVLASTSICFDLSVFELFAPLARAGAVVVAENALAIRELASKHSASLVNAVPSAIAEVIPDGGLPASIATVNLAGESLSKELVRAVYQGSNATRVYNLYGPTEDSTYSTFALIDPTSEAKPEVGRPISNSQAYVLHSGYTIAPPGMRGAIYLGGAGLARGYLGRPDLTAECFLPAPFPGLAGARMYRTGDLGRFSENGKLEFLGRADHQVKLRGFRIELGEIEAVLRQHPAVREAAVLAVQGANAGLAAYVVCADRLSVSPGELKGFLSERIPSYMWPSAIVVLPRMPITPNGKVNRRALEDAVNWPPQPQTFAAPRTGTEELIARIWEEMLGVNPIGVDHNFFDLGGHSLLAARVLARIRQATGAAVPVSAIFQGPTIGQLAQIVDGGAAAASASSLVEIQRGGNIPSLYLVPGIGGGTTDYINLALALGPDQPVKGFSAAGVSGAGRSLEEIAELCLEDLLRAQASGPYLIGGWSFGAVAAFEIARQLRSRHKLTALLVLFDMPAPTAEGLRSILDETDSTEARVMAALVNEITRGAAAVTPGELEMLSGRAMLDAIVTRIRSWSGFPADVPRDVLSEWLSGYLDRFRALLRYRPKAYSGRIILFRARQSPADNPTFAARIGTLGPALGWDKLSDRQVEMHYVDGSHYTMLDPPHVKMLGAKLRKAIETALQ